MKETLSQIPAISQMAGAAIVIIISLTGAGHALLNKRHAPAAFGWVCMCIFLPGVGVLIYYLLGINRIGGSSRRRALGNGDVRTDYSALPPHGPLQELAQLGTAVTGLPLCQGNWVAPLFNGEQAFPAMLATMGEARETINLSTYIFEANQVGRQFVDSLSDARKRGVQVRVLIDGVGELYSRPRISKLLRKRQIPCQKFIPLRLIPPSLHFNLRNHRKILTVDGGIAFTGGMNIGDRYYFENPNASNRSSDIHFRIEGPVIAQLERIFLHDWQFVSGEMASGPELPADAEGGMICRSIIDGPDDNFLKLQLVMRAAILTAERRVALMTPYFLPPDELLAALQTAALKGVQVDIILPGKNNLPYVAWATSHMIWQLMDYGVNVYHQPPPFAHSKLLIIDDQYSLIGTANVDPRSLRLNFEVGVEVYSTDFANTLLQHFDKVKSLSVPLTLLGVNQRSLAVRVRDGLAWLAAPYL